MPACGRYGLRHSQPRPQISQAPPPPSTPHPFPEGCWPHSFGSGPASAWPTLFSGPAPLGLVPTPPPARPVSPAGPAPCLRLSAPPLSARPRLRPAPCVLGCPAALQVGKGCNVATNCPQAG